METLKKLMTILFFICTFACTDCSSIHGVDISELPVNKVMAESYLSSVEIYDEEGKTIGSGIIIKNGGGTPMVVLTAAHVVDDLKKIMVGISYSSDKKEMHISKINKTLDLALLVSNTSKNKSGPYVNFSKYAPNIGDPIWVIGNPSGESRVVTEGIISKNKIRISVGDKVPVLRNLYRITADIYGGNSGGGVFNKSGELVGIVVEMQFTTGRILMVDGDGFPHTVSNLFCIYPEPGAFYAVSLKDILTFLKA